MKYLGYLTCVWCMTVFADLKGDKVLQNNHGLPGDSITSGSGEQGVAKFLSGIAVTLQDITAIASVLAICIVGIMYIMSRGEEEKTDAAKKYIIAIFIGLVLALSAWAIISLIDIIPTSIKF